MIPPPLTPAESGRLLLKLAALLETLPEKRFYFDSWATGADLDLLAPGCGTRACAAGWATTIPEMIARGLVLRNSGRYGPIVCLSDDPVVTDSYVSPYPSLAIVFGVEEDEARFLFLPETILEDESAPDGNASASEVAAHIRSFVARYRPEALEAA